MGCIALAVALIVIFTIIDCVLDVYGPCWHWEGHPRLPLIGPAAVAATLQLIPEDPLARCVQGAAQGAVEGGIGGVLLLPFTPMTPGDLAWNMALGCASGAGGGGGGGPSLANTLKQMTDRQFKSFIESVQTRAAQAGHATRNAADTRIILDEALRRGWKVDWARGVEDEWEGEYVSGEMVHIESRVGTISPDCKSRGAT